LKPTVDVRNYLTQKELEERGYNINLETGEVKGKTWWNSKSFEIVQKEELKKAKQERKKELEIQQSLDQNIKDLSYFFD
jgi:non-homologous end joining protein Ku